MRKQKRNKRLEIYANQIILELVAHDLNGKIIILKKFKLCVDKPPGIIYRIYIDDDLKKIKLMKEMLKIKNKLYGRLNKKRR